MDQMDMIRSSHIKSGQLRLIERHSSNDSVYLVISIEANRMDVLIDGQLKRFSVHICGDYDPVISDVE